MVLKLASRDVAAILLVCLAGRSFLAGGAPGLLALSCGAATWGTANLVTLAVVGENANARITVGSMGMWLSALCYLSGAVLSLRVKRSLRARGLWLGAGLAAAVGAVGLVTQASFRSSLPVFFVEGHGGMPVRYVVLGSTIAMLLLTAMLLRAGERPWPSAFTHWYALALILVAVGLFGLMILALRNSALDWTCRAALDLGGIYLLIAAFSSRREYGTSGLRLGQASEEARYPYAVAMIAVLACAAVRLVFLQGLGSRVPFATFFPAVMLAALYGGFRAGLLASVLTASLIGFLWMEPAGDLSLREPADWLALATLLLVGALTSLVVEAMQRAERRAQEAETQARIAAARQQDLEALAKAKAELARANEELERKVRDRTARLQELVSELEHFSYTITHDMRAPLRAMKSYAEMVNELSVECPHVEQRTLLNRIMTAADRMDALIRDALSYSQAVRKELPLEPVDAAALLSGMLDTYPELQPSKTHIRVEGELPVVMANEAGLTQCFSNLLGNAVKFVKPGERPQIRLWAERREDWVRLWIEDQGIGIPRAMQRRVFDMFARGHQGYLGTGIGLALVRKVVDRMGGKVGVESEEGKGSRFWLELRAEDATVMGRAEAQPGGSRG
jgi:signal transduction histidine kinase